MSDEPHVYPEGCYFKSLADIKDKHITVMGLGLNGGGEACVKFFLQHGAYVTVTDMKSREELLPTILSLTNDVTLDRSKLKYVLGEHRIEDFAQADCVIKNPGVKYEGNKFLAAAKAVETDLSIFLYFAKEKRTPVIAVTGSKGKSSTASSIYYGLQKSGFTAFLGGNITVSPLTFLENIDGTTPVVLELSSWQLRDLRGRKVLKPKIAVITKIVPDHQNWYHSMDKYVADKRIIYENQTEDDFTIVDGDEDNYKKESENPVSGCASWGDFFARDTKGKVLRYSQFVMKHDRYGAFLKKERDGSIAGYSYLPENLRSRHAQMRNVEEEKIMGELLVPGSIMRINLLKSALVLQLLGIAPVQIADVLGSWEGLAHRMEAFHTWKSPSDNRKIVFYNDSCATVPEAAAAATQAFKQDVILITGGTDKELDFLPLAQTLSGENGSKYHAKDIYLLEGSGTDKLTFLLDARRIVYFGPYKSLDELLGAVREKLSSPGSRSAYGPVNSKMPLPVVFSPGCTSFGMFQNEFDRGEQFKKKVKELFF